MHMPCRTETLVVYGTVNTFHPVMNVNVNGRLMGIPVYVTVTGLASCIVYISVVETTKFVAPVH